MDRTTIAQGIAVVAGLAGLLILICVWLIGRREGKGYDELRVPKGWRPQDKRDR